MPVFEKKYIVDIAHVGASNLLTNYGMLSILENIACKHSDIAGFGINDIHKTHLSWVLLNWKVKILQRVTYGTELCVRTWAKCSNKFNTYRDFEVRDPDGNLVCIATTKWALIDIEKNGITRITDEIINQYGPMEQNVFEDPEINKLVEPNHFSNEYIYQTQRRDIDVNQHMHNLNYLLVGYEALPEDIYFTPECNNIEVMYKKGIRLGDTVKCLYSYSENSHYITMKSTDDKYIHCIIKMS